MQGDSCNVWPREQTRTLNKSAPYDPVKKKPAVLPLPYCPFNRINLFKITISTRKRVRRVSRPWAENNISSFSEPWTTWTLAHFYLSYITSKSSFIKRDIVLFSFKLVDPFFLFLSKTVNVFSLIVQFKCLYFGT